MSSTIFPNFSGLRTLTLYMPRTSELRKPTMSSMVFPIQRSGVSSSDVSPSTGGTSGPMETMGYPCRPTNTPGAEPYSVIASICGAFFTFA